MAQELLKGVAAGAVGTTALNAVAYLDMVVRGRPASETPARAVEELAERIGVKITDENRKSALGALLGYASGLGIGLAYGVVRPRLGELSTTGAGLGLGLAAMVATNLPMTALGLTDPRTWSAIDWVSDVIPHAAYGLAAAATFGAMRER